MAWSYELLTSRERRLFETLAVFPGEFDLPAAAAVSVIDGDLLELHELRKELKRLRYTAELARDVRPARKQQARAYLRSLRALQDGLGALLDAEVARSLLEEVHAPQALKARLSARSAALVLADLAPCFQRFAQAAPFWT